MENTEKTNSTVYLVIVSLLAGMFASVVTGMVKERFFVEENPIVYVRLKDFLGEKIEFYGKKAATEDDRIYYARLFKVSMEKSLKEMSAEYRTAIFTDPAIIEGGVDVTDILARRVDEKMEELQ